MPPPIRKVLTENSAVFTDLISAILQSFKDIWICVSFTTSKRIQKSKNHKILLHLIIEDVETWIYVFWGFFFLQFISNHVDIHTHTQSQQEDTK